MIRHYYTLYKIIEEIESLRGMAVTEAFSQEKNSFVISFGTESETRFLHISADPVLSTIFLRDSFARARKNTVDVFPDLLGSNLKNASIEHNDRIVTLDFGKLKLICLIFGGPKSNVLLCGADNGIIDALLKKDFVRGDYFEYPEKELKPADQKPGLKIRKALAFGPSLLGKEYADELLNLINIDPETEAGSLSASTLDMLQSEAMKMRQRCLDSNKSYILENKSGDSILSLIQLSDYPVIKEEFDSVSAGIKRRIVIIIKERNFRPKFNSLKNLLERRFKSLQRKYEIYSDPISPLERAEKYRLYGDILLSQPGLKTKKNKKLAASDWEGKNIEIALDEKLSYLENAHKYYDKASSSEKEAEQREKMFPEIKKEYEQLQQALDELYKCSEPRDIEAFRNKFSHIRGVMEEDQKGSPATKFRQFDLGQGYMLYVGKNAANNDELTMKFASPNDLWFHARGASGSHAVLRSPGKDKPPKDIIRKSAEIAGYYSSAKNAKYAPVAYTYKKYVRKPKGANPGAVVIAREEVIMVEPKLPEISS
ncbi:MAG: NFACT RNA binding domain-containing protein [Candidatus Kapaibacterium sp.]